MITIHNTNIIQRSLTACRSNNYLKNKMKFVAILLVCTLGWASSASTSSTIGCTACKNTVDWMRMNGNVLSTIKSDERFNAQFIELLESDESTEAICGRLSMCETADDFINSFRRPIGGCYGRKGKDGGLPHCRNGHGGDSHYVK